MSNAEIPTLITLCSHMVSTGLCQQYQHIVTQTKWPTMYRQHFQKHFFKENCFVLIQISLKHVLKGLTDNGIGNDAEQTTSNYLKQWWPVYRYLYESPNLRRLKRSMTPQKLSLSDKFSDKSWSVGEGDFFSCTLQAANSQGVPLPQNTHLHLNSTWWMTSWLFLATNRQKWGKTYYAYKIWKHFAWSKHAVNLSQYMEHPAGWMLFAWHFWGVTI